MTTLYDYEQWKDRQQQNSVGAAEVVLGAATEAPDALANDMNLASEYGKTTGAPVPPPSMVKEYRPVFQQAIEREKARTILSQAPRLTEWLRNPENATLSRDDLQTLSWFDGFGRGLSGTFQRMGERVKLGANQFMLEQTAGRNADRQKTFGQMVDEGRWRVTAKDGTEIVGLAGPSAYLGALARWVDARYADLIGTDDKAAAESFAAGIKTAQDRLAAIPKSEIATEFEHQAIVDGSSAGEAVKNWASAFMANPIGGLSWALETAGESAPQIAAALGVTALTRNPSLGIAAMGSGSYATERYTSPVDFLKDKGIDLGKKEDVARLISDPTLLREAADKGVIRGLIIGAFDAASGGIAGLTLARNPVVEAIAQAATQAISGSAGEYAARVATGQKLDWNEILAEGFAEMATTPVDFGIAGRRLMRERAKAPEAEANRGRLEEVSAMAQGSALRNRMPDKFRDFVAAATANGPVENVYIPADEFVQYFQGVGVDPYSLIDGLEGVTRDDLDVALAGGGDLQIPTATYAAKIAGTEHDAFLLDNMKFDPDAMSARQAAEFNERSQDAMDEAFEEAERLRLEDEQSRSFEQEIFDTTVSQLRAAGRSTDVATTEALVYVETARTAAADEGMTIDEYLRAYPLPEFRGQLPEGMQAKDVDALSRTLAEARSRRSAGLDKRQTLLEFISDYGGINDPGGELRSRNAEVIKRGPGKKTLKLSRKGVMAGMRDMLGGSGGKKFGVDDVAQAAVEAGFMADDPTVMAYKEAQRSGSEVPDITSAFWNAIDEELRGRAQFSEQEAAPVDAEREAALDRVEEYLSRLGKSLDDDDADIREAIRQDREGRQYAQSSQDRGGRNTPVQRNGDVELTPVVISEPRDVKMQDALKAIAGFRKEVVTMASGERVTFTQSNKSVFSWMAGGLNRQKLIPHLREIMTGAVTYADAENANTPGQTITYAAARVDLNGQPISVRVILKDVGDGVLRQYQIEGFEVAATPASILSPEGVQKSGPGAATARTVAETVADFNQGRRYFQVSPDQARLIDMPVELPSDPAFAEAVANTPGATITDDGLLIDLVRYQKEEQAGSTSVRTGVFYLPTGSANTKHYKGGKHGYGGRVEVRGETLLERPLFVKGATGGKAPEAAFDAIKGKGAYQSMRNDVLRNVTNLFGKVSDQKVYEILEKYGADPDLTWDIVANSKEGNQLAYALQENIVAHAVREAGYDSVLGYSVGRGGKGAFVSEVFDVREVDYPTPGETASIHPDFAIKRPLLFQRPIGVTATDTEAFKRWFGDSKVVDEGGKPLVVYHGTRAGDFEAFDTGRTGEGTDFGWFGTGSYFTTNPDEATNYATIDEKVSTSRRPQGSVYPVYLKVENPYITDESGLSGDEVEALREEGYDGIFRKEYLSDAIPREIVVFDPTQIKSVNNRGTFDPADPRILFQRTEAGAFGSIRVGSDGRTIIDLFQGANLSTVLHETGHYWLINLQQRAVNGSAVAAERLEAVKLWWRENAGDVAKDANRAVPNANITADDVISALDNGTTGDAMKDGAIDVGMQEQFARGAEAYFMEGKAPTAELRTAFEKFRSWLIATYRRLLDMVGNNPGQALNVNISDELRQVFDRMIATDAQIAEAQEASGEGAPVFATAEAMGLSEDEYAAFLKLRAQAQDEAKARLLRETMEPIKRQDEKWFKTERAKVREEMERQVNAQRAYRAYEWMGNGRWLGVGKPDDLPVLKLSKDILVQRYGVGVLKTLSDGRRPVYTTDGGSDPDDVAGWFGFDSGDEMVRAIEAAPRRIDAIEAETDKRMRELHGDPLNDGSAEALALEAVHNDKRGQWLAAELKAVAEVAGVDVAMTAKEARASARSAIARMRVHDAMNANRFLAAERKAGREAESLGAMLARDGIWMRNARRRVATKARGVIRGEGTANAVAGQIDQANRSTGNYNETVARFVEVKRRQLLNHAFYMEARKVADEVEKAERFVAKLNKASTRERIAGAGRREDADTDYLAAIDDILDRYDFRRMSGAAEERRGALGRFVEAMKAAGRENELAIPETVLADAARKPYKTIPVEELRGVVDSLKNLEHIALRWNDLIDAINKRNLDEAVDEIVGSFDANVKKRPPARVRTTGEGVRNATRQFLDWVLNATTILREIDGFKDFGPAYRNIKAPIDDAMNRLIGRKEKAAADLEKLYEVYTKDERRRMAVREHIPALGYALSKWERIAVALNTGNEGNFTRLTDPRVRGALTPDQVQNVLATLDERDADFVQSVWDYVGSFRSDIAARERRTTGVEPEWVEAQPITIAGKTLRGGYYPLKYDPRLSSLARDDEQQQIATALQAGRFGKAQTRNGHLQARAQSSGRDIELDMSVLHRHVNQVIYDLELSEPVSNAWRVLQDGRVRNSFIQSGKQADFDALETWLKDVAEGELKSADLIGRGARMLKSNFTAAKLAFNLTTVAMQVTGLAQSMVVVGKRDFAHGVTAMFSPGAIEGIAAKSAFMRTRQDTFNKDIYDFYNDPKLRPVISRWSEFKRDVIGKLAFWLMTKVQWHVVDVPTWLAGYHQGLRKFKNDEAKAIAHADDIVKRAQASGLFSDRSAIERGSVSKQARQNDVVRLFTALGSYMFAKFNVAYERSAVAARTIGEEGASARSAREAASWAVDMAFLFTLEAVLTAAIRGGLPSGDDDDDDDGWLKFLAKQTAFAVMGTVPFVRDVASASQGFEGGGAYGAITKEASAPFVQAFQGEADKALVRSIINATGLVSGLPSTQINRAVDAAMRSSQGEDVSPLEYLFGKSKK